MKIRSVVLKIICIRRGQIERINVIFNTKVSKAHKNKAFNQLMKPDGKYRDLFSGRC
jgi:hypothetical protein